VLMRFLMHRSVWQCRALKTRRLHVVWDRTVSQAMTAGTNAPASNMLSNMLLLLHHPV
jgi:hypothetical protein